jgi:hypothetical protein
MITTAGNTQILNLMAGKAKRFADLIALGAGTTNLTASATNLGFGWASASILDSYVDAVQGQVVFHAVLDANLSGTINEIGLIVLSSNSAAQSVVPNNLLYTFSQSEQWQASAPYTLVNSGNVGLQDYQFTNAVDGTSILHYLNNLSTFNFSTVKLACTATNITSVEIRLEVDPTNYLVTTMPITAGAQINSTTTASYTTTGVVNPNNIKAVRLIIHPTGAASTLTLDGLSIEVPTGSALVAHSVLATPIVKRTGATLEIERAVKFSA